MIVRLFRFKPDYRRCRSPPRSTGRKGRVGRRDRDVQQQRGLPGERSRGDVPFVSCYGRRAASDARPREHVAVGVVRASSERARCCARMRETMDLCIGCKGCKRECPTGVDMAKMKIEFLHHYHDIIRWRGEPTDRISATLRSYAARLAPLLNLRDRCLPGAAERAISWASVRRENSAMVDTTLSREARPLKAARSSCSSIPLTAISSRRMRAPRSTCCTRRLSRVIPSGARPAVVLWADFSGHRPGRRGQRRPGAPLRH